MSVRGLADQIRRAARAREVARELGVALALAAPAEDHVERLVEGRDRAPGRRRVRRLGVVDVPHAAGLGDLLEPMRDAWESLERPGDLRVSDAKFPGSSRCGRGVLAVVSAGNHRLRRQLVARLELHPTRATGNLVEPDGHHCHVASPWFSKIRSFAARYASIDP